MTASSDERMLRRLVEIASSTRAMSAGEHVDPEDLALFVAGRLAELERQPLIDHLAACDECREWAGELLKQEDSPPLRTSVRSRSSGHGWYASPRAWLAAAAIMLIAVTVGLLSWPGRGGMTEQTAYLRAKQQLAAGRFSDTTATIDSAERRGVESHRLRSLKAQAIRRIPNALALGEAGRLVDFGVDVSGAVARDAAPLGGEGLKEAIMELGDDSSQDLELLLNRGHAHLTAGDLDKAERDFGIAAQLFSEEPLAWLGLGLVAYLKDSFADAEQAFRKATELDANNTAARMNLAMALQEQDKRTEAIDAWKAVLARQELDSVDRTKIEAVVRTLAELPP